MTSAACLASASTRRRCADGCAFSYVEEAERHVWKWFGSNLRPRPRLCPAAGAAPSAHAAGGDQPAKQVVRPRRMGRGPRADSGALLHNHASSEASVPAQTRARPSAAQAAATAGGGRGGGRGGRAGGGRGRIRRSRRLGPLLCQCRRPPAAVLLHAAAGCRRSADRELRDDPAGMGKHTSLDGTTWLRPSPLPAPAHESN